MLILVEEYSYINPIILQVYFDWFNVDNWTDLKKAFEANFNYKMDAA